MFIGHQQQEMLLVPVFEKKQERYGGRNMAVYYVDPQDGKKENSGLSPLEPLADGFHVELKPGDSILYKRGSFIRGKLHNVSGEEGNPIRYGAYGEGENPVFCGSLDLKESAIWKEEEKNIWTCEEIKEDEVGNFVFEHSYGTLRWTKEDLCQQGDFYDPCFGYREQKKTFPENHKVYLYSEKNPAEYYETLEAVVYGPRRLAKSGHDMVFEDITFVNSGVHGIAGGYASKNLLIKNCTFKNIGGCVWNYDLRIRFGNGVEFWEVAQNIKVCDCLFLNIYDSGVTHQGTELCKPAENLEISNNIFIKCGMAAYEQRDLLPLSAVFCHNICMEAGEGFSKQGETMPRKSEIWPEPMGHHVFLWRIEQPAEGAQFAICDNVFLDAPYGGAVYSVMGREAEEQVTLDRNVYRMNRKTLVNHYFGKTYDSLQTFTAEVGKEKNGVDI